MAVHSGRCPRGDRGQRCRPGSQLPPSASRTSVRRPSSGMPRLGNPWAMPSSGRTGGPRSAATGLAVRGWSRNSSKSPDSWSIPTSPAPSSSGSYRTETSARRANAGQIRFGTVDSFLIWRLTKGRIPCDRRHQRLSDPGFSTLAVRFGVIARSTISACRRRCCPRSETARASSGLPMPSGSVLRSRSRASRATSRRHWSAKGASRRDSPRAPTAPGCFLIANTGDQQDPAPRPGC